MKTVLVLVALVGAAMAVPTEVERIVGGADTTIQQYNFMVAMQYSWRGVLWYQECAGSLITSRTILSASHCYDGDLVHTWRAQLGSSNPDTGGTVIYVDQFVLHAQYSGDTLDNDVAIIRLVSAAPLGANIGTARIAGANYILADNTPIWAIGWGAYMSGGPFPDVLQHVEVLTVNWQLCADRYTQLKTVPGYQDWPHVTPGMSCAGIIDVGGRGSCQGDNGGPVVHNGNVVYGVTSWGFGCGNDTYPRVNAAVYYYANWIVANGST